MQASQVDLMAVTFFFQIYTYISNILNPNKNSPKSLQDKVQFDIRFYFCRRGNENIDQFIKETFIMEIDPTSGLKYVRMQKDEITKNHQDDTTLISGFMPEVDSPSNPSCSTCLSYIHDVIICGNNAKKMTKSPMLMSGTSHLRLVQTPLLCS